MKVTNRAELLAAIERRQAICDLAVKEKRDWTPAEAAEAAAISNAIDGYRLTAESESIGHSGIDRASLFGARKPGRESLAMGQKPRMQFRDVSNGQIVSALRPNERVHASADSGPVFSDYLLAAMGNSEAQGRVSAALSTTSATAGGIFVPETISRQFIDLARARSAVIAAGCQTVTMNSPEMKIVRVTSDPTPEWRGELQNITMSQPAFGAINVIPKSLGVTAMISRELVEDGQNAAMQVESILMAAMGQQLDLFCLRGVASGAGPTGLRYQTDVNVLDYADLTTPKTYRHVSWALRQIFDANYTGDAAGLGWLMPPCRQEIYDSAVDLQDQPLQMPASAAAMKRVVSSQIPDNLDTDKTEEYFGDFSECVIFMRTGIELKVSDAAAVVDENDAVVSVFSKNALAVRATLRADFICLRPTFFSVVTNLPTE